MNIRIMGVGTCCMLIMLSIIYSVTFDTQGQTGQSSPPSIAILQPEGGVLYVWSRPLIPLTFNKTIIIGPIVVQAGVTGFNGFEVDFYIDGELKFHDNSAPFEYSWIEPVLGTYLITAELTGYGLKDSVKVFKII